MIKVEGGKFQMGAKISGNMLVTREIQYEYPIHEVTLSNYYIGETEVTQQLWKAIMGTNPSYNLNPQAPVEYVSWNDCKEFIRRLNKRTGLRFRLPTEAEWEFAARGGNLGNGCVFSGSDELREVGWYDKNSSGVIQPVKSLSPNELGIYDMSGNVFEWCEDWYSSYSADAQVNPKGPKNATNNYGMSYKVIRGGGVSRYGDECRVSCRSYKIPGFSAHGYGFRLALQ